VIVIHIRRISELLHYYAFCHSCCDVDWCLHCRRIDCQSRSYSIVCFEAHSHIRVSLHA